MKTSELMSEIEKTYYNHFPNSKIFVKHSNNLFNSIRINCFLAGDKSENSGNYWDNDIFNIRFQIMGENGRELPVNTSIDSELGILTLENDGKSYLIIPENKYMAYGSKSVNFRKVQGDTNKIIFALDKFFSNLKKSLTSDFESGNITSNHVEIVKRKI